MVYQKRIIQKWLKLLELDDYQVKYAVRNPKDIKGFKKEDAAMIDIDLGEKRLNIFLNRKDPRIWDERLLLHELTHVLLYRMWELVDQLIQTGYKDETAQKALRAAYENLEEETIDRLVLVFTKLERKSRRRHPRSKKVAVISVRRKLAA
ncbi:MAG: hypothetical protein ABH845_02305 [Candidatus Omnitrophota bacterium]